MIKNDKRIEYEDTFNFWECNQITEDLSDQKEKGVYCLSHRPVNKETNETADICSVWNAYAYTRKKNDSLNDCFTKISYLIEVMSCNLNRFRK